MSRAELRLGQGLAGRLEPNGAARGVGHFVQTVLQTEVLTRLPPTGQCSLRYSISSSTTLLRSSNAALTGKSRHIILTSSLSRFEPMESARHVSPRTYGCVWVPSCWVISSSSTHSDSRTVLSLIELLHGISTPLALCQYCKVQPPLRNRPTLSAVCLTRVTHVTWVHVSGLPLLCGG